MISVGRPGKHEGPLQAPSIGKEIAAAIPGSQLNFIEGAGDMVPEARPQEWAEVVGSFLLS